MNASITEPDDHKMQYPLYYDGTTSHDYEMACFVLGNKSVTIQDMNAVYSREDEEYEVVKMDIGNTAINSIG
jgi:hypothetical protein